MVLYGKYHKSRTLPSSKEKPKDKSHQFIGLSTDLLAEMLTEFLQCLKEDDLSTDLVARI